MVFRRGIERGLNVDTPRGGQHWPSSGDGASLLWKKDQKKEKKKSTSDVINSIIASRRPLATLEVCWPWNVLSRIISRHHCIVRITTAKIP